MAAGPDGGEVESPVQEGELVVDCDPAAAEDAADVADSVEGQAAQDKGPAECLQNNFILNRSAILSWSVYECDWPFGTFECVLLHINY